MGSKTKMVAIPTTSGTGSEVTSFAVITDKQRNKKYPLADYELTPDVAIIDPDLVMSLPKSVTADTGMDVLTHAIEAYVSVMASDYTDGLAEKAIELVFEYLPKAYEDGTNRLAREKMHNASSIAGMAFTNAFLGVNHSIAHKLGGEFHIPHGKANAIILPYVIKYNGTVPTKMVSFPKYEHYIADQRYATIAKRLGLPADTTQEGVNSLTVLGESKKMDGAYKDNIYGTYVHGIFDKEQVVKEIVIALGNKKGIDMTKTVAFDMEAFKETQYDILAAELRKHLDMDAIYNILSIKCDNLLTK
jgi:alcohol dehydrogenase class IV